MPKTRRRFTAALKAQASRTGGDPRASDRGRGRRTVRGPAEPDLQWKREFLENAARAFESGEPAQR